MTLKFSWRERVRSHIWFWFQRQLCRLRHDYEFVGMDGNQGVLECFYCEQLKKSGGR